MELRTIFTIWMMRYRKTALTNCTYRQHPPAQTFREVPGRQQPVYHAFVTNDRRIKPVIRFDHHLLVDSRRASQLYRVGSIEDLSVLAQATDLWVLLIRVRFNPLGASISLIVHVESFRALRPAVAQPSALAI